jgi:hypothetical protein
MPWTLVFASCQSRRPARSGARDAECVTTDGLRLLRHFGVRALVLAFVSCLTGMTTMALCLTIAGLVLLYAPVRAK